MDRDEKAKQPNMNKTAIALQYNPEDNAPKVIASGKGYLAEKILDTAKQENVPIHKDAKLSASLSTLTIGEMIPPELYEVVAEVLAFVDHMDQLKRKLDMD
jgi:flagellar biosynthesis protein